MFEISHGANPMTQKKQKKRCRSCGSGKHTKCDVKSANGEGQSCPCCGGLTLEAKEAKEFEIKRAKYEKNYEAYAGSFDAFLRGKCKMAGLNGEDSPVPCLPKNGQEEKAWSKESGIPRTWMQLFIEECRQDYPEK